MAGCFSDSPRLFSGQVGSKTSQVNEAWPRPLSQIFRVSGSHYSVPKPGHDYKRAQGAPGSRRDSPGTQPTLQKEEEEVRTMSIPEPSLLSHEKYRKSFNSRR